MSNSDTKKTVYLWGPVSGFTGPLVAWLVKKGWDVHIACKSSLNLFSLSPLDLKSTAQNNLDISFGGHELAKAFQGRIKLISPQELNKNASYDAVIFAGLPPNFDDPRAPRAPWSIQDLKELRAKVQNAPLFVISSLFAGVQNDGVVPEELEFSRRKPLSSWEGACQQYEIRLLEEMSSFADPWYLIRLPFMLGSTDDGAALNFNGLYHLMKEIERQARAHENDHDYKIALDYNPNSTLWFMPVDSAVYALWRFLEDSTRPRILNLVPTNSTLNREWIEQMAKALGTSINCQAELESDPSISSEEKTISSYLPSVLKKLLKDDIQVKTRNLFEVAGRYHIPPVPVDSAYFERIASVAKARDWGEQKQENDRKKSQSVVYSDKLARFYFEDFLQELLNSEDLLVKAVETAKSIAFVVKEAKSFSNRINGKEVHEIENSSRDGIDRNGWILKSLGNSCTLEPYQPTVEKARICFKLKGKTLVRLILNKLPLHRALLTREVEVEGPLLPALKVANHLDKFLSKHPVSPETLNKNLLSNAPTT